MKTIFFISTHLQADWLDTAYPLASPLRIDPW